DPRRDRFLCEVEIEMKKNSGSPARPIRSRSRSHSKPTDKPGSVTANPVRFAMTVIPLGAPLPTRSSHLPADVTRAASMSAYLVLLRMEVAAFHPLPHGLLAREATRLCGPVPRLHAPRERRLITSGSYPAS